MKDLLLNSLEWGLPALITVAVTGAVLWIARRAIPNESDTRVARQLASLVILVLGNIALVLALPIDDNELKKNLLGLFGLVITAVIALSSTTFVSNAMAGLMLRSIGGFRPGDFIHVGEHFGCVTEKGLLHTEIQSEDRDLITLPNLFLMNQPVKVVHTTGTLISAEVSLGYDVHRHQVRDLLKQAATDAELKDSFVHITALNDHSVNYRAYGFLENVSSIVSKRSELRAKMLDALHGAGVEIVSPQFMNQRRMDPALKMLPPAVVPAAPEDTHAERLMFDKGELAARLTRLRAKRDELTAEIAALKGGGEAAAAITTNVDPEREISFRERQVQNLTDIIGTLENDTSSS